MFEFFDGLGRKWNGFFISGHGEYLCRTERIVPHYLNKAARKWRHFVPIHPDSPKLPLWQGKFSFIEFIIDKVVIRY
jgi:hypothetical protein